MPELIDVEPGSPEWLAARRGGVTATDIVTILGLSSYDSPYSLFWRKLGQVPDEPDRDRWELGKALEPYIVQRWADANGVLIRKAPGMYAKPVLRDGGLYQSDDRPWQLATPDRICYEGNGDISEPVEVKSWADADRSSWHDDHVRYTGRIGDDGEHLDPEPVQPSTAGRIPPRVRAQVLWQMDVLDAPVGHVGVVFLPSGRFESYTIEHENGCTGKGNMISYPSLGCSVCDDIVFMREAGEEFWRRMRLELPPPDLDSSAATLAAVRARFTRADAKQAEIDGDLWAHYEAACLMVKAHEELRRVYEIRLREQAGEASELCVDGELVARRVIVDARVKAHTRHQDYLRRVKPKENGDD